MRVRTRSKKLMIGCLIAMGVFWMLAVVFGILGFAYRDAGEEHGGSTFSMFLTLAGVAAGGLIASVLIAFVSLIVSKYYDVRATYEHPWQSFRDWFLHVCIPECKKPKHIAGVASVMAGLSAARYQATGQSVFERPLYLLPVAVFFYVMLLGLREVGRQAAKKDNERRRDSRTEDSGGTSDA